MSKEKAAEAMAKAQDAIKLALGYLHGGRPQRVAPWIDHAIENLKEARKHL